MNRAVLNSTGNSGPSVGASSMVTDANSALSGGPHLQRSASINTESYLRLPASPMSFSSNNMGSSVMDGSSIVQQSSHQDQTSQQRQRGASTATSQPASHTSPHALAALTQEPNYLSQMQKKPRLDIKQEDILQPQVIQQMFQRQEPIQLQGHNPQLQALIQQQRLLQRHQHPPQQILQSMPQIQRANLQQQLQQQQQMRQHVQQQGVQPPLSGMKRPFESGVCARRLMQYIYHQRNRPADNTIVYWRKFVAEYYAPRARKRWCLSLYDNVGQHALGVFPQAAMDAWQCDICGSKSGRGFEATFEVLPRLSKIKFDSGVIDELLFVDMPREYRFPSGIMMLEYGKAVQESVYEQLRVVREGQLRIAFTPDLKILSWEFCARRHEELLPRRFVAPQVNQLLQVAQKYQTTVTESGSSPVSPQDLQANCNMFLSAGRQLARNLELQSLNDLGFSKRYVRCLQISEVVNSMKDLIDFCREQNIGPIESLKNYPRQAGTAKFQIQKMQEMEQQTSSAQGGLPNDRNTMNQVTSMHSGTSSHVNNNNNHMMGNGVLGNSAQASVALNNYQNLLRQNSMNSNTNVLVKQEGSCSLNSSNQAQQTSPFQGSMSLIPGPMQNAQVNGLSSPHQSQNQHHPLNANLILQQNHPQSSNNGNPNLQHHMIQQLLQEMMNNNGGGRTQQPPTPGGHNTNRTLEEDVFNAVNGKTVGGLPVKAGSTGMVGNGGVGFANNSAASISNVSGGGIIGGIPNRSNSFKSNANSNSSSMVSGNNENFNLKASDVLQNLHLPDISHEFSEWDV